jgi:hypothetical protein
LDCDCEFMAGFFAAALQCGQAGDSALSQLVQLFVRVSALLVDQFEASSVLGDGVRGDDAAKEDQIIELRAEPGESASEARELRLHGTSVFIAMVHAGLLSTFRANCYLPSHS